MAVAIVLSVISVNFDKGANLKTRQTLQISSQLYLYRDLVNTDCLASQ